MVSLLLPQFAVAEDAAAEAAHISPWWYGGFSLFALVALLVITMVFGKGRPHS
ncbi:hypothetical protein [Kribbella sp. NPDC023855]|uniref:hypothetical protein n=1 Tax=Kribbella sp. NPDC023855 TaxID=3154698 RepID=UPI00340D9CC3